MNDFRRKRFEQETKAVAWESSSRLKVMTANKIKPKNEEIQTN